MQMIMPDLKRTSFHMKRKRKAFCSQNPISHLLQKMDQLMELFSSNFDETKWKWLLGFAWHWDQSTSCWFDREVVWHWHGQTHNRAQSDLSTRQKETNTTVAGFGQSRLCVLWLKVLKENYGWQMWWCKAVLFPVAWFSEVKHLPICSAPICPEFHSLVPLDSKMFLGMCSHPIVVF